MQHPFFLMGKNSGNSWLSAVRRAFRSPSSVDEKRSRRREENFQEEEDKKSGKRRWMFRRRYAVETTIQHNAAKINGDGNLSERRRPIAVAMARAAAAVATAQAAVEYISLTAAPSFFPKQHGAALVIQTMFRGYLARRALVALKGVVHLQALIRGHLVRKRAKMTLQCVQSLVRVQALVCDQRRRRSFNAASVRSVFGQANTSRKSISSSLGDRPRGVEEIQAMIQRAKECSLKQIMTLDEGQFSDNGYEELEEGNRLSGRRTDHLWVRTDGSLRDHRDPTKTSSHKSLKQHHDHAQYLSSYSVPSPVSQKHRNLFVQSPKTPSSSKMNSIQAHSSSPSHLTGERNYQSAETPTLRSMYFHRMSTSESSGPLPRPNYMAATASAMARVRSHSTPRQRLSSPGREQIGGSVKKRLSFPVLDAHNADGYKPNGLRCKRIPVWQVGGEPYCYNE